MEELVDLEGLNEKLHEAIVNRQASALREIFEVTPAIDIAEAMEEVDKVEDFIYIFRVVPAEYTSDFFAELTDDQQELIIKSLSDKELIKLLENSFSDDIADALDDMPANLISRVLKVAPSDIRKDINQLLKYKDNTAGSLMQTEYISMRNTTTVEDAIKTVRKIGKDVETVYTIFVKDSKRTLVGTVLLDDLLFAENDETLENIMDRDFVTCNVNDDQEDVANAFKRYDLTSMAVVNNENKILGIITVDDVVDVLVDEATEDIAHLAQISSMETPYLKTHVFKIVLKCLPWIICLMILQVFSTMILSGFDEEIAKFALLSVFTPLIMDAGGNSGGQTTTMIVRSLSLDEFDKGDFKRVIWKELRVASCVAACVSTFAFGWLLLEMTVGIVDVKAYLPVVQNLDKTGLMLVIAGLVSGTLFVTMIISRMVGCMLPFLAKKLKLDPAVMCGPLTTTMVDIVSLLTYFFLWTEIFLPIVGLAV